MKRHFPTISSALWAAPGVPSIMLGFAGVALIMTVLVVLSVMTLRSTIESLVGRSSNEHVVLELFAQIQTLERERSVLLQSIVHTDDPFVRYSLEERLSDVGQRAGEAREALLALDLPEEAEASLLRQRELLRDLITRQQLLIEETEKGGYESSEQILLHGVEPSQHMLLQGLSDAMHAILSQAQADVAGLRAVHDRVHWVLLVGVLAGLLLVAVIGLAVARHMGRLINDLKRTATELAESLQELEFQKIALDRHCIVSVADVNGNIIYANKKFCEVSQYTYDELKGKNHRILKSSVHDARFYAQMWDEIAHGRVWQGEVCNLRKDGTPYWVWTTIVPFLDDNGLPYQYVSVRTDISQIKQAEAVLVRGKDELECLVQARTQALEKTNARLRGEIKERELLEERLKELAITDTLTGIFNRRNFEKQLGKEVHRAQRYEGRLSLVLFDVDYFKRINDQYGHQVGDGVLRALSTLVAGSIRDVDVFSRWGGEEFVILMPGCDAGCAVLLAKRLRGLIAGHRFKHVGRVTCSFGVAELAEGEAQADLLRRADMRLYEAKANGRNRVEPAVASNAR